MPPINAAALGGTPVWLFLQTALKQGAKGAFLGSILCLFLRVVGGIEPRVDWVLNLVELAVYAFVIGIVAMLFTTGSALRDLEDWRSHRSVSEPSTTPQLDANPPSEPLPMRELPVLASALSLSHWANHSEQGIGAYTLDVHEVRASSSETSLDSHIHRTITLVRLDPTPAAFQMEPLDAPTRWVVNNLFPLAGVERISLTCDPDDDAAPALGEFIKNYMMRPLASSWIRENHEYRLAPGAEASWHRVFDERFVRFFATSSGWNFQIADGWLALWREERVLSLTERSELVTEALKIHAILSSPSLNPIASLAVHASPRRFESRFPKIFGTVFGGMLGSLIVFFIQFGLWIYDKDRFGPPRFVLIALGTMIGALLGYYLLSRWLQSALPSPWLSDSRPVGKS